MITPDLLKRFCPASLAYLQSFQESAREADLTEPRLGYFMANVALESGGFRYPKEIWGPTPQQARYGARADLGNTLDTAIAYAKAAGIPVGKFYAGVGLMQVTGYSNILACSLALFGDDRCARDPSILARVENASRSASWYWKANHLNDLADEGDFVGICGVINRGTRHAAPASINGLKQRQEWLAKWRAATGA